MPPPRAQADPEADPQQTWVPWPGACSPGTTPSSVSAAVMPRSWHRLGVVGAEEVTPAGPGESPSPPTPSHLPTTHPPNCSTRRPPSPGSGAQLSFHSPGSCPSTAWRTPMKPALSPCLNLAPSVPTPGEPLLPESSHRLRTKQTPESTPRDTRCVGLTAWCPLPPAAARRHPHAPHPSGPSHTLCPPPLMPQICPGQEC